jgi:hypothetical protein
MADAATLRIAHHVIANARHLPKSVLNAGILSPAEEWYEAARNVCDC